LQRHFPVAWLLPRRLFSIHDIRSLLRPARPERFAAKFSVRYISIIQIFFSLLFLPALSCKVFCITLIYTMGAETHSDRCSHVSGSYSVCSFFFRFGGSRPLHTFQIPICSNLLGIPTTCFMKSSPKIFLNITIYIPIPSSWFGCHASW
jgi:hypothetical protein